MARTPASAAGGTDLIPGHKSKILHAASKKEKKEKSSTHSCLKKKKTLSKLGIGENSLNLMKRASLLAQTVKNSSEMWET